MNAPTTSMSGGWTGGQYSLLRAVVGSGIALGFAARAGGALTASGDGGVAPSVVAVLVPGLAPLLAASMVQAATALVGVAAGLAFAVGWWDRAAAVAIGVVWALGPDSSALWAHPQSLALGCILLAHLGLPTAPYLSWTARERIDPAGDWEMPPEIAGMVWIAMAATVAIVGPPQAVGWYLAVAAGALLALSPWMRPWVWAAWVLMVATRAVGSGQVEHWWPGLLALQLLALDPAWIRPRPAGAATDTVFYDGNCGLCHRTVRLLLAELRDGATFRFAALDSETARDQLGPALADLPDSIALATDDGRVLVRSDAVARALERLGGFWRVLGLALRLLPRGLRDGAYDQVAAIRHRLFARPKDVCPLMPEPYRGLFLP